jgi:hypothetical protein
VTTLAGLAGVAGSSDGAGNEALFSQPTGLALDGNGTLYVTDTGNALIRRVTAAGAVTLVAGVPGIAGFADGVGLDALFDQPRGVVWDGSALIVADTGNAALRKITGNAAVSTLALTAAPVSTPPDTPPAPPPSQPSTGGGSAGGGSSGGGGGGAPSFWFVGALTLLWALRHRKRG